MCAVHSEDKCENQTRVKCTVAKCSLTSHLFHVQLWLAWRKLKRSWLEMPSGTPLTSVTNSENGRSGMERSQPEHYISPLGTLDPSIHLFIPNLNSSCVLIWPAIAQEASEMKEFITHLLITFPDIAAFGWFLWEPKHTCCPCHIKGAKVFLVFFFIQSLLVHIDYSCRNRSTLLTSFSRYSTFCLTKKHLTQAILVLPSHILQAAVKLIQLPSRIYEGPYNPQTVPT